MPPLVSTKDELNDRERYLAWFSELEHLLPNDRRSALMVLPKEFNGSGWRRCLVDGCFSWFDSEVGCQRHVQCAHHGKRTTDVFDTPSICGFPLPRPLGRLGLPEGPMIYCQERFELAKDLKKHKLDSNHKRKKKNKSTNVILPPPPPPEQIAPPKQVAPPEFVLPQVQLPVIEPVFPNLPIDDPTRDRLDDVGDEVGLAPRLRRDSLRAPIQSLKEQFLEFIHSILRKVEQFILTPEQGSKAIVKFISAKSHVRSDTVEASAKKSARQIPQCETEEKKRELLRELVSSFETIEWD
jgi:hypothetical protein